MQGLDLSGHVVVAVGDDDAVAHVAAAAVAAGALVAHIAAARPTGEVALAFHADAGDADAVRRIGAHIEQRLGPIDAVVCDGATHRCAEEVFSDDLRRRRHGRLVVVGSGDDVADALSRLVGMR